MKKILSFFALILVAFSSYGWGGVGHRTVIAIAQRHISEKTKAEIARYFDYDIKKDAVWMDSHRKDSDIAYTTAWHVYNVDENHRYDPDKRAAKGDCLKAVRDDIWVLENYKNLPDSVVILYVRELIHFVGDFHCPTHSYLPGPRNFWKCSLESANWKGEFHGLYDKIPQLIYPDNTPDEIAAMLDNCSKSQIKKIQQGTLEDWAKGCGDLNEGIYVINPFLTTVLDPDTLEKSKEIVDTDLRNAGYRLAYLLNLIFDK